MIGLFFSVLFFIAELFNVEAPGGQTTTLFSRRDTTSGDIRQMWLGNMGI
jgi:hypothetical protein